MTAPTIKEEEKFIPADEYFITHKLHDFPAIDSNAQEGALNDFVRSFSALSVIQHRRMLDKGFYESFYRVRDLLVNKAKGAYIQWQWAINNIYTTQKENDNFELLYKEAQSDLLQYTTNFLLKQKCLMHEEMAESSSALRENDKADDKIPEYGGDATELADAIIRILDYAGFRGIDVAGALMAKMAYNLTRPKMHGKNA